MEHQEEMDPVIAAIWKKFGKRNPEFIEIDDERYFGKKFDSFYYFYNRTDDNITSARTIRVITMDFYNLYPQLIHSFMKIWREGASNHIAEVSLVTFLDSQQVLDLFRRGVLSFYGVSITKSDSKTNVEKYDISNLTVKEAWNYFAREDRILVIQNPTPDKKSEKFQPRADSNVLPFENNRSPKEIGEFISSVITKDILKNFKI